MNSVKKTGEEWATRIGLVLAMAGGAIGLGNFLRFPVKAAQNGGGAFMIPYFSALLLLGIPLMWVEWSIGRFAGRFGYNSAVGAMGQLTKSHRASVVANFLGFIGITGPLAFAIYYTYIESWTLAYSFFSVTSKYSGLLSFEEMSGFLGAFQGKEINIHFSGLEVALLFFVITVSLNYLVIARGISRGVEKLAKIALPLLFIFALILVIRVWTIGTPDPLKPENSVMNGFAYLWNPDFSYMTKASTWLAAAGQIFFSLGIGLGSILTYASYLKSKDDIALTGLTTSMTNEFAEVILGGSIAIPVAVAFFGLTQTEQIAQGGTFDLGFVAMPVIFQKMPYGEFFGMIWFLLLFFAGITSSVALCSPAMAFLQDQMGLSRPQASKIIGIILLVCGLPVVFFLKNGFLDEMDFWAGTFGLVLFALLEVILFSWIFGMKKAWKEITTSAEIHIPGIFKFIIKYISPLYLIVLLVSWAYQDGIPILLMKNRLPENIPYLWAARLMILALSIVTIFLTWRAYKKGTLSYKNRTELNEELYKEM
jgi:NSS family neurotransmitter:Na+ symporter